MTTSREYDMLVRKNMLEAGVSKDHPLLPQLPCEKVITERDGLVYVKHMPIEEKLKKRAVPKELVDAVSKPVSKLANKPNDEYANKANKRKEYMRELMRKKREAEKGNK